MVTQFDEKGKIFTQVVAKHPVEVIIATTHHLIHGEIHVRPGTRVKDELNGSERFVAVTNVTVKDHQDRELYRSSFLVVNIDQINWVIPGEEINR